MRDDLLGREVHDWDIEVHDLPQDTLEDLLKTLGTVDAVGRAFSVFKLTRRGVTVDVSLPRRDSNAGPGHRGIAVRGDPHLGLTQAVRRRDLTLNAILRDPLTGELVDPASGLVDLKAGVLRPVDETTFLEDPLRALRAVQFAARLNFTATDTLRALCLQADVHELPPSRICAEWFKLLLAPHPARGFALARETRLVARVFPDAPVDTGPALQAAVAHRDTLRHRPRAIALMLTTWLAPAGRAVVTSTLDRLGLHRVGGYRVREAVQAACGAMPLAFSTSEDLRRLATHAEPLLVLGAHLAHGHPAAAAALANATDLGVLTGPLPALIQGRDLVDLGLTPGPHIGEVLNAVYEQQLTGALTSPDAAREAASAIIASQAVPNDEGLFSARGQQEQAPTSRGRRIGASKDNGRPHE